MSIMMEIQRQLASCQHSNNQLLICAAGKCFQEPSKVFVCSQCCFDNHNHGLMNFVRPSQFQKYCCHLEKLTYIKDEVERQIKGKFAQMKVEVIENLSRKQEFLLKKLEEILPNKVTEIVYDCFIKHKIKPEMENELFQIVKHVRNIQETKQILIQCKKVIKEFALSDGFLFKNNIFDLSSEEQVEGQFQENSYLQQASQHHQNLEPQPQIQQDEPQPVNMTVEEPKNNDNALLETPIKTQNVEGQSIILKYSKDNEVKYNGTVYIDLQQMYVPIEIRAKTFQEASFLLKNTIQCQDLNIIIDGIEFEENVDESLENTKIVFLENLSQMKNVQNLSLEIKKHVIMSFDNVTDLESTLLSLDKLKYFKAKYCVTDVDAFIYEFAAIRGKLGANNVLIRSRTIGSSDS